MDTMDPAVLADVGKCQRIRLVFSSQSIRLVLVLAVDVYILGKSRELFEINAARFSLSAYVAYGGCVPRLTAVPDDDAGRSSYAPDV